MTKPTPRPAPELLAEAAYLLTSMAKPYKPSKELVEKANDWLNDSLIWAEHYTETREQVGVNVPAVPTRVNGKCAWCADPMPVPDREQGGGRTKRFCSPACKQAHHRWTRNPERHPDAQTWTLQRRGLYSKETR